ncbi:GNAT family N-acetyltransferase [Cohnella lubricantis]|uniref:N-acetyltransferase n=1 Tax=Cohnella lubricantis TaxID=2163172 RepID=A0A841TG33_9BACL|nr:GNAT family N-acetyltransferase [Cohnella lubricantis]MBB6678190.1 N-acetyltransferase [Cohnella lubricantis]MBP2119683.1 ribosomal protein S18 acetylase RimI-like enzyme [Cohnella lubricantis]
MKTRLLNDPPDERLSFELYAASRASEMEAWGWPEELRQPFLAMQFRMQQQAYKTSYPNGTVRTIEFAGAPVGKLHSAAEDDTLVLIDLSLLPEYRSRGIGTEAIRQLQCEAAGQSFRKVRLTVRTDNPALRLYERLGFVPVEQASIDIRMEWVIPLQI